MVGALLKTIRTQRTLKISQYTLAKRAGVTRHTIQMLENGKQGVTLYTLIDIARGLDVSMAELGKHLDYVMTHEYVSKELITNLASKKFEHPKH